MKSKHESYTISIFGKEQTYEIVGINEFSSDRKRMSIVLKKNGVGWIFAKGADNIMLDLA